MVQVVLNASVAHLAATQYAVRTPLGVDWKILSIRKESMLYMLRASCTCFKFNKSIS